jgi:hypothetical protein
VPALFVIVLAGTVNDYFNRWANDPQVLVQYESSLATAVGYLNEKSSGAAAISTTTPDRFHSPAAGELFLTNPAVSLRWFNGQYSLLIPQTIEESTLLFSGFAPLSDHLSHYAGGLQIEMTLPMRESDLDRPITIYRIDGENWLANNRDLFVSDILEPVEAAIPMAFGEVAEFLGYDLQTPIVEAGQEVRLVTLWRTGLPLDDGVLFAQLLDAEGRPVAQSDRLDVPSYYWIPGDIFLQLHRFTVPEGLANGRYALIIGLYTRSDEQRVPVLIDGAVAAVYLVLPPIEVGFE